MKRGIDWVHDRLHEFVYPGYTVFDVGAHIGHYTEEFLRLIGESGKIEAFELNPNNYQILKQKFALCKNIVIKNVAVSDHNGQVDCYAGADSYTGNIIGHDTSHRPNRCIGKCSSLRLDTYYQDQIDLMKIDVEGAELEVLHGCKGIIKNIKYMLVECHFDEMWSELRNLILNDYGYTAMNLLTNEPIGHDSDRPNQCLCKKKNNV